MQYANKVGRPRKVLPENYEYILDLYIKGRIGTKECKKLLGLADTTKLTDCSFYRKHLVMHGIYHHRNNVDMWNSDKFKNSTNPNRIAAVICYRDGSGKIIYMSDRHMV